MDKKVYVVIQIFYEGSDVKAVFDDEDKAIALVAKLRKEIKTNDFEYYEYTLNKYEG